MEVQRVINFSYIEKSLNSNKSDNDNGENSNKKINFECASTLCSLSHLMLTQPCE